jgi:hypothetical protein
MRSALKMPELLFADDFAGASFTSYGLEKKILLVDKDCKKLESEMQSDQI